MARHQERASIDDLFALLRTEVGSGTARNLRHYCRYLLRPVPLSGSRVLDIGGGAGLLSFYSALSGAAHVDCLEPDAAGSAGTMQQKFAARAAALQLDNVSLRSLTLQQWLAVPDDTRYDVVLIHNAVNHLDEESCRRLHVAEEARRNYDALFSALADRMMPGAAMMIADCTRNNLWPALGLRNPFRRTITWSLHQPPELWESLLAPYGFRRVSLKWSAFNALGQPGRVVLGNRFASWLTLGHFALTLERTSQAR